MLRVLLIAYGAALLLSGCGGGGGGDGGGEGNSNTPRADAGIDQSVNENRAVMLDGTNSSDNNAIASFSWRQIAGDTVVLSGDNTARPSFTTNEVSAVGDILRFELTVTDDEGLTATDQVEVIVNDLNNAPIARAGNDQTVSETDGVVTLDGSASTDPDVNGSISNFQWNQISGPTATLRNSNAAIAEFDIPAVPSGGSILVFRLTVTDNAGGTDTDDVAVSVTNVNQPPTANAGNDNSFAERSTAMLDGSSSADPDAATGDGIETYSWVQTGGTPAVTLSDSTAVSPTFTAPDVMSAGTMLEFTLTVTDGDMASSSDIVSITITNVNLSPTADAGDDSNANNGDAVTLDGSGSTDEDGTVASYRWTQTGGQPTVTINNDDMAVASFTAPSSATAVTLTFTLTVADDSGAESTDDVVVQVAAAGSVVISGKVTYDHVPPNTNTSGLDYSATQADPVRGATVQAIVGTEVVFVTKTDGMGDYAVTVPPDANVVIRVLAEATLDETARWDVAVVDNTNGKALYVLDSAAANSGFSNSSRNLNAASGYTTGSGYTSTRAAAPFAILDSIYEAMIKTREVDADVQFPVLTVNWSVNNRPVGGDLESGEIGTSFYLSGEIYVLGAENNDTDEYDGHIVVHEWGHYFEDNLSRADNIGGSHTGGDRLDPRVAMGEGFGNALSGIITGDPVYRDSSGDNQADGFAINGEQDDATGWYDERTVLSILYDLFDANNESAEDTLSLGWAPLYETFVSDEYRNTLSFTTLFSYITRLRADNPGQVAAIDALVDARGIESNNVNSINEFASNEINNAGSADVLPVYTQLTVDDGARRVCSTNEFGVRNKLSVRRYLDVNVTAAGQYRFRAESVPDSISSAGDPDVAIFTRGELRFLFEKVGNEDETVFLPQGVYLLNVFDFGNVTGSGRGRSCIDVSVSAN